jgi:hypothetical protein
MLPFLDFDGVLHAAFDGREPDFCRLPLLGTVLRAASSVSIVISSTCREGFALDELRGLLSPDIAPRVVGVTLSLPASSRHAEIMRNLEQHATHATERGALDDAVVESPRGGLYLIFWDPRVGLTDAVARELELRLVQMQTAAF